MGKTIRGAERQLWRKKRDSIRRQVRSLARSERRERQEKAAGKTAELAVIVEVLSSA